MRVLGRANWVACAAATSVCGVVVAVTVCLHELHEFDVALACVMRCAVSRGVGRARHVLPVSACAGFRVRARGCRVTAHMARTAGAAGDTRDPSRVNCCSHVHEPLPPPTTPPSVRRRALTYGGCSPASWPPLCLWRPAKRCRRCAPGCLSGADVRAWMPEWR